MGICTLCIRNMYTRVRTQPRKEITTMKLDHDQKISKKGPEKRFSLFSEFGACQTETLSPKNE